MPTKSKQHTEQKPKYNPIHPIEYRYGSREMKQIFTRDSWLAKMLQVEAALAWAQAEVGDIPKESAQHIVSRANLKHVTLDAVSAWEAKIQHETMAVVKALTDASEEPHAGMIHKGATSYDIQDSTLGLQIKEALNIIEADLRELAKILVSQARKYSNTICLGRTHGIVAVPTVFGFKMAVWASDVRNHIEQLKEARKRVCVGKMSGAVGTMAGLGKNGLKIQKLTMQRLGLRPAPISTQIIQRESLAEFLLLLSQIASTLDKMANEIRNLQRSEIHEVEEPFNEAKQVGSSTMPHKRNPILSESICGLARSIRGSAVTALENVVLEHERDLTNSSYERITVPETCILLDEALKRTKRVMKELRVYPNEMKSNLERFKGVVMSESVMLTMTTKGANRQRAHGRVRRLAMDSLNENKTFETLLKSDTEVRKYLSAKEIESALNPANYLGTAREQIKQLTHEVEAYIREN
jgi:adenylosuccinate lyase